MQRTKPVPGGSGTRPTTSTAFRKAARWLRNRLQAIEARENQESGQRAGIGEDALRKMREGRTGGDK